MMSKTKATPVVHSSLLLSNKNKTTASKTDTDIYKDSK
jgi:hypothetical protein